MKAAFIGLGQMGKPMATNLAKIVPGLMVSANSGSAFAELERCGAVGTHDRQRLAEADVVFLSLPDEAVVEALLFGPDGLADRLRPGAIVVDTSTIGHVATLVIARELAERRIGFVDAPVSGMQARAIDGSLTAMCGGTSASFEAVRPLLASMASTILHMGGAGSGQLAKLVNQLLFDIHCAALAEILPMAVKLGLDADQIGAVVNGGTGRSYASEFFVPRMLQDRFGDGYPLKHAYKDLIAGAALSAQQGIPLPVLAAATSTYQTALLQGHGDLDKGAMIKVFERLLGVEFRSASTAHPDDEGSSP